MTGRSKRFLVFRRVERVALVGGLFAVVAAALTSDLSIVGGVLVGAAIGWLNLNAVRVVTERGLSGLGSDTPERRLGPGRVVRGQAEDTEEPEEEDIAARRMAILAAFGIKFLLLVALITVVILLVKIHTLALIVGFSVSVLSVAIVPLLNPLFEGKDGAGAHKR